MISIKNIFKTVTITLIITNQYSAFSLKEFNYRSASVLPIFHERSFHTSTKWVILTREAHGAARGYYDDCSGGRDRGEEHPLETAAREFYEEAILKDTVDASLAETKNFIDINSTNNTENIIIYSKDNPNPKKVAANVTYVTNVQKYKNDILKNFYPALKEAIDKYDAAPKGKRNGHFSEKDRIAIVRWNDLKDAIINCTDFSETVRVPARVLDPVTQRKYIQKNIKLRPYLVMKLRPFFLNEICEIGESDKVRVYNQ